MVTCWHSGVLYIHRNDQLLGSKNIMGESRKAEWKKPDWKTTNHRGTTSAKFYNRKGKIDLHARVDKGLPGPQSRAGLPQMNIGNISVTFSLLGQNTQQIQVKGGEVCISSCLQRLLSSKARKHGGRAWQRRNNSWQKAAAFFLLSLSFHPRYKPFGQCHPHPEEPSSLSIPRTMLKLSVD